MSFYIFDPDQVDLEKKEAAAVESLDLNHSIHTFHEGNIKKGAPEFPPLFSLEDVDWCKVLKNIPPLYAPFHKYVRYLRNTIKHGNIFRGMKNGGWNDEDLRSAIPGVVSIAKEKGNEWMIDSSTKYTCDEVLEILNNHMTLYFPENHTELSIRATQPFSIEAMRNDLVNCLKNFDTYGPPSTLVQMFTTILEPLRSHGSTRPDRTTGVRMASIGADRSIILRNKVKGIFTGPIIDSIESTFRLMVVLAMVVDFILNVGGVQRVSSFTVSATIRFLIIVRGGSGHVDDLMMPVPGCIIIDNKFVMPIKSESFSRILRGIAKKTPVKNLFSFEPKTELEIHLEEKFAELGNVWEKGTITPIESDIVYSGLFTDHYLLPLGTPGKGTRYPRECVYTAYLLQLLEGGSFRPPLSFMENGTIYSNMFVGKNRRGEREWNSICYFHLFRFAKYIENKDSSARVLDIRNVKNIRKTLMLFFSSLFFERGTKEFENIWIFINQPHLVNNIPIHINVIYTRKFDDTTALKLHKSAHHINSLVELEPALLRVGDVDELLNYALVAKKRPRTEDSGISSVYLVDADCNLAMDQTHVFEDFDEFMIITLMKASFTVLSLVYFSYFQRGLSFPFKHPLLAGYDIIPITKDTEQIEGGHIINTLFNEYITEGIEDLRELKAHIKPEPKTIKRKPKKSENV